MARFTRGTSTKRGYCVFLDTLCQGPIPVEHDGSGHPIIHENRKSAERSIVEDMRERLDLYLEGILPFEEAVQVDEYVREVVIEPTCCRPKYDRKGFPN